MTSVPASACLSVSRPRRTCGHGAASGLGRSKVWPTGSNHAASKTASFSESASSTKANAALVGHQFRRARRRREGQLAGVDDAEGIDPQLAPCGGPNHLVAEALHEFAVRKECRRGPGRLVQWNRERGTLARLFQPCAGDRLEWVPSRLGWCRRQRRLRHIIALPSGVRVSGHVEAHKAPCPRALRSGWLGDSAQALGQDGSFNRFRRTHSAAALGVSDALLGHPHHGFGDRRHWL